MKKIVFLLIAAFGALSTMAQVAGYKNDNMSGWVVDVNMLGGMYMQNFTAINPTVNYPNALNVSADKLKFNNGFSYGGDAQIGFFFGQKRHFGIGTGFMYLAQGGDAEIDNFHVEYQSADFQGNTFRQLITSDKIRERIRINNLDIPVVLKYKTRFSRRWGFTADAGVLLNVEMQNRYKSNSAFDYEAIYKFTNNSDGSHTAVYDNSPVPANNDWLITKSQYLKNNADGNVQQYFNGLRAQGFNVGLGATPNNRYGKVNYTTGSVGLLLQPAMSLYLSDHVALNFGVYYLYQPFKNTVTNGYRLTDKTGDYSSMLNSVSVAKDQSYGLNIGARFFFGKKNREPEIVSSIPLPPTACGVCDAAITLHGLPPGKTATVNYKMNNDPAASYTGTVDQDSSLKIPGLCPGSYTDIEVKVGKRITASPSVALPNPPLAVVVKGVNPSENGACNASLMFNGLKAGKPVTVNYSIDVNKISTYYGYVADDNTVTVPNLCAGTYTNITIATGNCETSASNVTLTAPAPPPAPPVVASKPVEYEDISAPILFELNKAVVHKSSYPLIEKAAIELKEHSDIYIQIDGHCDITGPVSFNNTLSLKRANAVKNALIKRGADPSRIKTKGHGSRVPAYSNKTREGRMKNRRAIMTIKPLPTTD